MGSFREGSASLRRGGSLEEVKLDVGLEAKIIERG
jgi:hypothetical protein